MTTAAAATLHTTATPGTPEARAPRDLRLDVFRGLAMFIIMIAHIPGNWWTLWIPARFGFSDAAEIFVFCSGMASAIAFGTLFTQRSWWLGTSRTAFRVYQVYWAQIGVFLVIVAGSAALTASETFVQRDYIGLLNLYPFINDPISQLPAFMTLTYVPNYFDILPMYLVILMLMPVMMLVWQAGERIKPGRGIWLFMGASLILYAIAQLGSWQDWLGSDWWFYREVGSAGSERIWVLGPLDLPAEPWSGRPWFFNPFAWQFIFFLGFALMMGWIRKPPVRWWLIALCAFWVILHIFLCYRRTHGWELWVGEDWTLTIGDIYRALWPLTTKTDDGPVRVLHFLSVAYLAWVAAGEGGRRLRFNGWMRHPMRVITTVGQQTLAVFVVGMVVSRLMGVVMDELAALNVAEGERHQDGRNGWIMTFVNLLGMSLLILTAYVTAYFRRQPWRQRRTPKPAAAAQNAPS